MNKPKTPEHVIYTLKTGTNYGSWSSVQPAYVKDVIPYIPQAQYLELGKELQKKDAEWYAENHIADLLEEKLKLEHNDRVEAILEANGLLEKLEIAREALEKLDALLDPDMGHSEINEASDIVQEALSKLQTKEGE